MPKRWIIVGRNPETGGIGGEKLVANVSSQDVIAYLRTNTGLNADELVKYAVGEADTLKRFMTAERWMEEHATEHVLSVWNSTFFLGQREALLKAWPELHLALSNLASNHTVS